MNPLLETIAGSLNYGDLPETWQIPDINRFSAQKTLYDYQRDALSKAARALFLYYGREGCDWSLNESPSENKNRKENFARLYETLPGNLKKYEGRSDERTDNQSPVFKILSRYVDPLGDTIQYRNFINRMCFWMATGSGKTLVMVKLIEYLHSLQKHGEIPPRNILILAPSGGGGDHLLKQIQRAVDEFNANGDLYIDLVPLRATHRGGRQTRMGNTVTVYYHRSDNISDVQKEALTDYRSYENGGKWYVFLDEAHKGGKGDSKRQAFYKVMSREGFLFNFSATFTDEEDILTTVEKYNLEEFIKNGHGKNIYLNQEEYDAFKDRNREINHEERRKIVLKSLLTLAYVSIQVGELRKETGLEELYHLPLMLTLVNSVNTDIENERNDLWAFFQTLREIATGAIDNDFFMSAKNELVEDWRDAKLMFGADGGRGLRTDKGAIDSMTVTDLREAVFLSRKEGALQFIRSGDGKELAFQMKNADSPFALIRIGDTSKWRNKLLAGYEETTALKDQSFFEGLEKSNITILMGSRSFFESWDSNRPNVINFINIGGSDAKKFVVQSVGRGVRIEPLPNQRRRFSHLPDGPEKQKLQDYRDLVEPPETLFLFATNRAAVKSVLEGLEAERENIFEKLEGFAKAPVPKIGGREMPLLVPEYKETRNGKSGQAQFAMSEGTLNRLKSWLAKTPDSVLMVRDGLDAGQISALRGMAERPGGIRISSDKNYAKIAFLQERLVSHLSKIAKTPDGIREVNDDDIVHFRQIRVHAEYVEQLQKKINQVKHGEPHDRQKLAGLFAEGKITQEEFDKGYKGKDESTFKELTIKKLLRHYYLPVVLGKKRAHYIQHIIKVQSEVEFLDELEKWTAENKVSWDAWMFSKIDESLDNVYIPYYDPDKNEYRRFLPDFVFWMCKGSNYRIVFVDPKGGVHTKSASHKIDGYKQLFEQQSAENRLTRQFCYGKGWKVSVDLVMFNPESTPSVEYSRYWRNDLGEIFKCAEETG